MMPSMSTYRGPVALEQIESAIGPFDEVVVATNGVRTTALRAKNAVGYLWRCGCEARGNASPFCVWRACSAHRAWTADLAERRVPPGYEGGDQVSKSAALHPVFGDVVVSAAKAIADTFAAGAAVGFVEAGKLVREFPDGRREVVSAT
jgi:hypothetical protein